jgi:hypothetical protein
MNSHIRCHYLRPAALLALMLYADSISAQSLADVARAEEARRKAIKSTSKVYTNDDLNKAGIDTPPPAPAAPAKEASPAKPETEKPPPKVDEVRKDEKYWKDRMATLQATLSRNKILADALQSRINALTTDFMNRDDPAQRAVIEQDRRAAVGELDRMKQDVEKTDKAIRELEEEGRKANVPPGWLR